MIITRADLKEKTGVDFYDGSIIHHRFAYRFFRDAVNPCGNIIAYVSPTTVTADQMVDLEDSIMKDFIYSDKMINFCFEIPLTNLFGGICFQRLFASIVGDLLSQQIKAPVEVEGDDIFVCKEFVGGGITQLRGKSSVSIVCEKGGAILGHLGINIDAGSKAPVFAYSTNMNDDEAKEFMGKVCEAFYATTNSIFVASSKVIV